MQPEKETLLEVIRLIDSKQAYKIVYPKKISENIFHIGYTDYNSKIFEISSIVGQDFNYEENFTKIKDKEITTLTKDEIQTYLTYIFRKERFIEGILASFIDDGILKKLIERYLELCWEQ